MVTAALASALAASPSVAQAEHEAVLTPASLTQVLSCQSRDALGTFAELLFLQNRPPAWMRPSKLPEALDGMIGLYGFAVEGDVSVFGEPVDHVYFMSDWVIALLPRASAERVIAAQKMARAPIAMTEQYYRFVDPETGPMIGGFAPTGDAMARVLLDAFGADPTPKSTKGPPSLTPKMLLVGCNYAVASQEDFLAATRGAEDTMRKAGADIRRMAEEGEARPPR
ncbi:hypothetical protein [Sphingomonas sp. CFBP 8760]|uniref:hypothetical protein n=1 Tax=Sphingomonas sp. CFBP 8760 TaxID=2775282 RepID=UPI001A9312EB|nr:hypothetical protein [Sphingomonas sp. CFBP 8760]